MSKKKYHSLKYKMQAQPNKTYKNLKQKQKLRISEWMFWEICEYYRSHGVMPPDEELDCLTQKIYVKIKGAAIWVPYEDVLKTFIEKQTRFSERIETQGLPEPPLPKQKKTEAEKLTIKRTQRKNRKKKEKERLEKTQRNDTQDDRFFFIAGYTSGGAAYGLTWEEMGMEPWQSLDDDSIDEE